MRQKKDANLHLRINGRIKAALKGAGFSLQRLLDEAVSRVLEASPELKKQAEGKETEQ